MTTTDVNEEEVVATPEVRASARFIRISASKARRVVDLVRGLPADEAVAMLRHAPQAAAEPVGKLVASAMANGEHNFQLDPEELVVARAWVDEGPTLRRYRPRAQGRAGQIRHRSCHITVVLEPLAAAVGAEAEASGSGSRRNRRSR